MSERRLRTATRTAVVAAGRTDPGRQREVNEDRFHVDLSRGIFLVVDGVGGHAAGGKAADVALARVRERLERETGALADRIREAIAIANNEVYRLASSRPEWEGMACVLTVAVVGEGRATIGHVGDTRLYVYRDGRLDKVTRDHSPVGEREDARELSEAEAMRHPRRNEVYRDVGSDQHEPSDEDFVEIHEIPFAADAAMLLCSDGLTDLVDSSTIASTVKRGAGNPDAVAEALIAAANDAGGKDNVTVVYVEGAALAARAGAPGDTLDESPTRERHARHDRRDGGQRGGRLARLGGAMLLTVAAAAGAWVWVEGVPALQSASLFPPIPRDPILRVEATGSIVATLERATPGTVVLVDPGEYREQLFLRDGVRVVSRVPGGASIRLPAAAADGAAVVASNLSSAEFVGFRIVGDAATPLGVGIFADDAAVSIVDVEVTGATRAAVEFGGGRSASLLASELHDNPGAALVIHRAATPRIEHNTFARNALSVPAASPLSLEAGAAPRFRKNVFVGSGADALGTLDDSTRLSLTSENWFIAPAPARRPAPAAAAAPNRPHRKQ